MNGTFVRRFLSDANPIGQTRRTDAKPSYPATVYEIIGIILRQTLALLALGVAVGVVVAPAATRAANSLLFDLQPNDPLAFAGGTLLLIAIALIAGSLPALRASRLDPMVALRYE